MYKYFSVQKDINDMQDCKVNNTILIVVSGDGLILLLFHFGPADLEFTRKLIYSNLAYNLNNEHSLKVLTTEPSASLRVDCFLSLESARQNISNNIVVTFFCLITWEKKSLNSTG